MCKLAYCYEEKIRSYVDILMIDVRIYPEFRQALNILSLHTTKIGIKIKQQETILSSLL